jgi:parallel beta-helix repeat protein
LGEGKTKKANVIIFTIILIVTVFTLNLSIENAHAVTITVGVIGDYPTIQDAIDNATTGDTIYIYNGTYYETIDITLNGITIEGENKDNTIIDGAGSAATESTVLIDNNNSITIKNLKIRNSKNHGIYAQFASDIKISNCIIYNNNQHGISYYSLQNIDIENCEIYFNYEDGIHIISSTLGIIDNNLIYDNYYKGIYTHTSENITITNSSIFNNIDGIKLFDNTNNIKIYYCNITDNSIGLSIVSGCIDNEIYLNNFLWNNKNAESFAINIWNNSSLGNYWDDYPGDDYNYDGIGDTNYTYYGVDDNYPLIHPYGSVINQNTGEIFLTIQKAIDYSGTKSGHTIFVKEDTYYENIEIKKDNISIKGQDKDTTIIDASTQKMNGILIKNHDYVTIQDFTIKNSPDSDIHSSNGVLILAYPVGGGNNHSNHNKISNCIVEGNGNYGILIYGSNIGQSTDSNIISNCVIFDNDYSGIRITNEAGGVSYSTAVDNQITNCEFYDNGWYGNYNYEEAALSISPSGIVTNTLINDNIFYYSYGYDVHITTGELVENNVIYHNNFLEGFDNVYDEGNNIWYNTIQEEGNYWACYDEPSEGAWDNNSDGIVDIPYNIFGGSNQDSYPLAGPLGLSPPNADANGPYSAYISDTITLTSTGSNDPDGTIILYTWDLGNGETKYGSSITYSYSSDGVYTVTLTVEDNYGLTDSDQTKATITIEEVEEEPEEEPENEPPVADTGGPYYEVTDVSILFDGSDSYDLDGIFLEYNWNFGDGHTSTKQMPSHAYEKEGNYTVKLTVTDEDGESDRDTTTAYISKKPNNPPNEPIINGTFEGHINTTYNFTINATDPDGDMVKFIINWDDGINETITPLVNSSEQFNMSHNWSIGGVYIVTAYTKDNNNATSEEIPYKIIIDAYYCGSFGYLVDKDGDGIFDVFYRDSTGRETATEKNGDEYKIDINNDSKWDYRYNFSTKNIFTYQTAAVGSTDSFTLEAKWIMLIVIISAIIILIVVKYAIFNGQKNNKYPVKKKEKKFNPKKVKKSKKEKIMNKKKIRWNNNPNNSKSEKIDIKNIIKEIDKVISDRKRKK